jgi:hypothetical protein
LREDYSVTSSTPSQSTRNQPNVFYRKADSLAGNIDQVAKAQRKQGALPVQILDRGWFYFI